MNFYTFSLIFFTCIGTVATKSELITFVGDGHKVPSSLLASFFLPAADNITILFYPSVFIYPAYIFNKGQENHPNVILLSKNGKMC